MTPGDLSSTLKKGKQERILQKTSCTTSGSSPNQTATHAHESAYSPRLLLVPQPVRWWHQPQRSLCDPKPICRLQTQSVQLQQEHPLCFQTCRAASEDLRRVTRVQSKCPEGHVRQTRSAGAASEWESGCCGEDQSRTRSGPFSSVQSACVCAFDLPLLCVYVCVFDLIHNPATAG